MSEVGGTDIHDDRQGQVFDDYTVEELLEQAQSNAQGTFIVTASFLHARGIPIDEWAEGVGQIFARGWDTSRPWDAAEFMDAMLTNFRAGGAEIVQTRFDPDRSEATISGWPDPDLCAVFGVDPNLAARYHGVAAPIAATLGLGWTWRRDGDETHLVASRRRDEGV